jgi:hypothetical protein
MVIEREEIQTKGTDNLFNNRIAENIPSLEKGRDIQVQETSRTPNCQDQKRNTPRHIVIKTLNIQNKEKNTESFKREMIGHI